MPDLESAGAVGQFDRRPTEFNMEVVGGFHILKMGIDLSEQSSSNDPQKMILNTR